MDLPIHDKDYFDAVVEAGTELTSACHNQAHAMGWHLEYDELTNLIESGTLSEKFGKKLMGHFIATKLMLTVSEVAEAMEGSRKNLPDDKLPHHSMLGCELADTVIRAFDLGGLLEIPLGQIIAEKLRFNATRPDHQIENREAEGGKSY